MEEAEAGEGRLHAPGRSTSVRAVLLSLQLYTERINHNVIEKLVGMVRSIRMDP